MFRVRGRSKLWVGVFAVALGYAVLSGHWQSAGYLLLRVV